MKDTLDLIEEVRRLDAAATPGPWTHAERGRVFVPQHLITEGYVAYPGGNDPDDETTETLAAEALTERNGELIARFRTLAPQLATELEAALASRLVNGHDVAWWKAAWDKATDGRLEGYHALGAKVAAAENALDNARAAFREEHQTAEGLRERLAEAEAANRHVCDRAELRVAEARAKAAEERVRELEDRYDKRVGELMLDLGRAERARNAAESAIVDMRDVGTRMAEIIAASERRVAALKAAGDAR